MKKTVYEFHGKRSGYDVAEAIKKVYEKTPPTFTILDFIVSVDGEDKHFSSKALTDQKHVGILAAGEDALAVDQYLHIKMGYDPHKSPLLKPFKLHEKIDVIGDDLTPLKDWEKVPITTRIGYKTIFKFINLTDEYMPFAKDEMNEIFEKEVLVDVIPNYNG